MKQCPTCNQTYSDDTQSFCLMDGSRLLNESEAKTIVMPSPFTADNEVETVVKRRPERKKSLIAWLVGLLCLIVLAGIGLIGWLFISFYPQNENKRDDIKSETNVKASISPSSPKPVKTDDSLVKESSPKQDDIKNTSNNKDSEVITPINWETTIDGFKGEAGQRYTFHCPEDGTTRMIFGTDVYASFSSICTAAVHSGLITLKQGGVVTVEFRPGQQIYGSTVRNGIKSNTTGENNKSFVFR
jgi:hypothetical protein